MWQLKYFYVEKIDNLKLGPSMVELGELMYNYMLGLWKSLVGVGFP